MNAGEHPLPIADAIIVAPATRNTIVQLASNGDADTKPSYAVVYLKYSIEAKIPIVILPSIKRDIMTPDFLRSGGFTQQGCGGSSGTRWHQSHKCKQQRWSYIIPMASCG